MKAFHTIARDDSYAFVGSTSVKYIPINEQVDLELGSDPEVQVKPTLLEWAKTDLQFDRKGNVIGWTIRETWQIDIQNSKPIGVAVDAAGNLLFTDSAQRNALPNERVLNVFGVAAPGLIAGRHFCDCLK